MKYLLLMFALLFGLSAKAIEEKKEDQKAVTKTASQENGNGASLPPMVINVTSGAQTIEKTSNPAESGKEPEGWWTKLRTDPIATFTGALFLATAALIITGIIQWKESRDTAKRQLRAYVALEGIHWKDIRHEFLVIWAKNYGQTPAHDLSIYIGESNHFPTELTAPQMLHPHQAVRQIAIVTTATSTKKVGAVIHGEMSYRDAFDQWWVTKICYEHTEPAGESDFVPYRDGNKEGGPHKSRPPTGLSKPS